MDQIIFVPNTQLTYQPDIILLNSNKDAINKTKTTLMGFDTIEIKLVFHLFACLLFGRKFMTILLQHLNLILGIRVASTFSTPMCTVKSFNI